MPSRARRRTLALWVILFGCVAVALMIFGRPDSDRSQLTQYSVSQLRDLSLNGAMNYFVPTQAPSGVDAGVEYNGNPPFNLADVTGQPKGKAAPYWRTLYSGDRLEGDYLVTQRPQNSALDPCLDWQEAESMTAFRDLVRGVVITVCAAPGQVFSLEAKSYWEMVEWTNDLEDVAWLQS